MFLCPPMMLNLRNSDDETSSDSPCRRRICSDLTNNWVRRCFKSRGVYCCTRIWLSAVSLYNSTNNHTWNLPGICLQNVYFISELCFLDNRVPIGGCSIYKGFFNCCQIAGSNIQLLTTFLSIIKC